MLKERYQRSSHRHDLRRRHVHVLHALGADQNGLAFFAGRNQVTRQLVVFVQCCIGLRDHILAFFNGRKVIDLVGDFAVRHAAVRCFDETVFIQAGVQGQRVDQANVRTFRCFNRAHAAIVGHVHVTHFKAGTLARQAARAKGRDTTLVRDLGQRVGLVHNCDNWDAPKNSFSAAEIGLLLIKSCGINGSCSA